MAPDWSLDKAQWMLLWVLRVILKPLIFGANPKTPKRKLAKPVQGGPVFGERFFGCFREPAALGRESPTEGIGESLSQGPRPQTPCLTGEPCTRKVWLEKKRLKRDVPNGKLGPKGAGREEWA